jgi:tetratricopeptide (TPR) repeat protein
MIAIRFSIALLFVLTAFRVSAALNCGELRTAGQFGPYDYSNPQEREANDRQFLVESAHFPLHVEMLQRGNSSTIGGDIDYTLRAFPNHYRALQAMVNLGMKEKTEKPAGAQWTVKCYFLRAIEFKPDDPYVHLTYSNYLRKLGKNDEALAELKTAEKLQPDDANVNYNLGLFYFEANDFEQSLKYAKKAYKLGFALPGLKNKLVKAGKWQDD